jgi:branched-chain amino acid transport system permease protein
MAFWSSSTLPTARFFVLGAFVGVEALLLLQSGGYLASVHPAVILLLVMVTAMVISGLAAMALERIAYRPLLGGPRLVALISAIGASFFSTRCAAIFESLWRNTFYLSYPTLDFLERAMPLGSDLGDPAQVRSGNRDGIADADRAAFLREPDKIRAWPFGRSRRIRKPLH